MYVCISHNAVIIINNNIEVAAGRRRALREGGRKFYGIYNKHDRVFELNYCCSDSADYFHLIRSKMFPVEINAGLVNMHLCMVEIFWGKR